MNIHENRPGIELITGHELQVVGEYVGGGYSFVEAGAMGVSALQYCSQLLDYMDATQGVAAFAVIVGVMFNGLARNVCTSTMAFARDRYTRNSIGWLWYETARNDLLGGISLDTFVQNVKSSKYGRLP